MEARILKIDEKPSKDGGTFYYFFFKEISTGKSYRSCISSMMRNFARWSPIVKAVKSGEDVVLGGLIYNVMRGVIDADSEIFRTRHDVIPPAPPKKEEPASTNAGEHIRKLREMLDKKGGEDNGAR